jgi:hypothetical protein
MWLKTYKSIGKLFDYGIMGQPLYSGCDMVRAPCNGATPEECSIRGIRTYSSMRGRSS